MKLWMKSAYGKNKGDLKGIEFGQVRAATAKTKNKKKKEKVQKSVRKNEDKVKNAKEKIASSKSKAEKARKNGKMSKGDFDKKMSQIKAAEQATEKLEAALAKGKKKPE